MALIKWGLGPTAQLHAARLRRDGSRAEPWPSLCLKQGQASRKSVLLSEALRPKPAKAGAARAVAPIAFDVVPRYVCGFRGARGICP
jgi:hypothetical protein